MKRRAVLAALVLAPATAGASGCGEEACNLDTLAPWFARLAAAREARGGAPAHVLQIGDSHTAGDALTGSWRALLQGEAGSGGRGVLAPGRPYDGYLTRGVTVAMSGGWQIGAILGKGSAVPRPPLGLASYSLTSIATGARFGLTAGAGMAFDRLVVCAIAGPGAGMLRVRTGDGVETRLDLAGEAEQPRCETVRAAGPQTSAEVAATDAPVTITSWAVFRDQGGVAVSNLGVVGAQLAHFARTDDAVLAEELRAYAPDLIVLAFGTNEGFVPRFDAVAYEAVLRGQVARLRALAPGVPLLLLGPPAALTRNAALRGNAAGAAVRCPDGGKGGLFAPPALAQVRGIQRRVAGELGVAWWDWQARMGGPCSALGWVRHEPALMRGDFVHFTSAGGTAVARLLEGDLERVARPPGNQSQPCSLPEPLPQPSSSQYPGKSCPRHDLGDAGSVPDPDAETNSHTGGE